MAGEIRRRITIGLNALALGLFPAFFVAVSVFADGQWAERSSLMLAIIVGYGCLGFLTGWLSGLWSTALWLSLPALPALLIFGENTVYSLVYFAVMAGCATVGAGAGAWTHAGHQSSPS